jgi:hypothetical protein
MFFGDSDGRANSKLRGGASTKIQAAGLVDAASNFGYVAIVK